MVGTLRFAHLRHRPGDAAESAGSTGAI